MKELTLHKASKQCCGNCGWSGPCMRIDEVVCNAPISAADMKRIDKRLSPYYHMRKGEGVDCEAWKAEEEVERSEKHYRITLTVEEMKKDDNVQ